VRGFRAQSDPGWRWAGGSRCERESESSGSRISPLASWCAGGRERARQIGGSLRRLGAGHPEGRVDSSEHVHLEDGDDSGCGAPLEAAPLTMLRGGIQGDAGVAPPSSRRLDPGVGEKRSESRLISTTSGCTAMQKPSCRCAGRPFVRRMPSGRGLLMDRVERFQGEPRSVARAVRSIEVEVEVEVEDGIGGVQQRVRWSAA
jgi:hypothetical protein